MRRSALLFEKIDADRTGVLDSTELVMYDDKMMDEYGIVFDEPDQREFCRQQHAPLHNGRIWQCTLCRFTDI